MRITQIAVIFISLSESTYGLRPIRKARSKYVAHKTDFKYTSVTPKPYLEFHDCFQEFQCARLQVPMDWNATSSNMTETIALGILRVPAHVPVTDPRWGGAILINPGGPGGSGVSTARYEGRALQGIVDAAYVNGETYVSNSSDALYFDVIGWDPRGVDDTTPYYTCQQNPAQQIVQYLQGQLTTLGTPEGNFDYLWAQYSSLAVGCDYDPITNPEGSKIEQYLSTSYVALDMVEIIEQLGQWREKQAQNSEEKRRLKYHKGEEPLLYAGGSYGTDLGQVFASMQPHRIKRMFLDGVDNTEDDISGSLLEALWDVDDIMDHCFEYCALAGPEKCALYNGPTAQDTRNRVFAILGDLEQNGPVYVGREGNQDASIVTLSDIYNNAYGMLYAPVYEFQTFAEAMAPLTYRNGSAFVRAYKRGTTPIFTSSTYENVAVHINASDPGSDTHRWASFNQISNAIGCTEAWIRRNKTEFRSFWKYTQAQSFWGAPGYATEYMACIDTFKVNTTWNFLWTHPVGSNVTAHPILLGSNKYDPITPLKGAKITNSRFKGSALVVNDGDGHEGFSNPSLEFAKIVRRYFQTGELPPPDQPVTLPLARPLLGGNGPRTAPLPRNASLEDKMLAHHANNSPV